MRSLTGPRGQVWSLAFTADSGTLVAGVSYDDRNTYEWDLTSDDPSIPTLVVKGEGPIWKIALSPDGRWLATSEHWSTTQVYDLSAKDPSSTRHVLRGFQGGQSLAISPDGRWLAAGQGANETAHLWDLTAPDLDASMRVLRGHRGGLWSVIFSADGRWLISGGDGGRVILWDLHLDSLLSRARRVAGRALTVEELEQFAVPAE